MTQALAEMQALGQSSWLEYIRRAMVVSGELQLLIDEGIRGINTNPLLLEKFIAGSPDYDDALRESLAKGLAARDTYDLLLSEDIRAAADTLRPIYERTGGEDGYACLDINPALVQDREGIAAEACRLFTCLDRPNVMVKVPATREGILAIEDLISQGIPVNATLICSLDSYEEVAHSYIRGLETRVNQGKDLRSVASVASFWVNPVDSVLSQLWRAHHQQEREPARGQIDPPIQKDTIALACLLYARFQEIFGNARFSALASRGARVQRLLWSATANQDPRYPEIRYVEALIGPNTVMSFSPSILAAFKNYGKVALTLEQKMDEAQSTLAQLAQRGIDMKTVGDQLQEEGMKALISSFEGSLAHIAAKQARLKSGLIPRPQTNLGRITSDVEGALAEMERQGVVARIWAKDHKVWKPEPTEIANRLGWLNLPERMRGHLRDLSSFAEEIRGAGFKQVVLLGLGGSSLAPEVLRATFGPAAGHLEFFVLDSTIPAWVSRITKAIDIAHTLFIASSKSGTTIEVTSLLQYFWSLAERVKGDRAGQNFLAITDPGTPLEATAAEHGFRRIFLNHPDLGGRYSALSHFGLVPASLLEIELRRWLDRAEAMAESCAPCVPVHENPGAVLGATIATLTVQGKDKLTLALSPSLASFGLWIEQLIAESTGKEGRGIIPVVGEPAVEPSAYGPDRTFVLLRLDEDENSLLDKHLAALEGIGQPTVPISLADRYDLAAEFFRWEFATAIAGMRLGIHPFDQPNVQESKENTERALAECRGSTRLPPLTTEGSLPELLSQARGGNYVALMAYLEQTSEIDGALKELRRVILTKYRLPTTLGYGPRFLHSTGQLHKGGPDLGLFVQLTADMGEDLPIPGRPYSFGTLASAQALGDFQSLRAKKRRVIRLHLGQEVERELRNLTASLGGQARG